jgi:heme-degrading monooxygenase HmoA
LLKSSAAWSIGGTMIRVIIKRQVTQEEKISELLRELRAAATSHQGYMGGETMVSTEDKRVITVMGTWRSLIDWEEWKTSQERSEITKRISPLLAAQPIVETYELKPAEELDFMEDPYGWLLVKEHTSFDG